MITLKEAHLALLDSLTEAQSITHERPKNGIKIRGNKRHSCLPSRILGRRLDSMLSGLDAIA